MSGRVKYLSIVATSLIACVLLLRLAQCDRREPLPDEDQERAAVVRLNELGGQALENYLYSNRVSGYAISGKVTSEHLQCLAKFERLFSVRFVDATFDGVDFTAAGGMPTTSLWLERSRISVPDLASYLPRLSRLDSIEVIRCDLGDDLLDVLEILPKLNTVWIFGTKVSDARLERFQKTRPDILIIRKSPD